MNSLLQKNLISTKEASALSGYNADYLSRLCREKKIASSQVGRTWLIESASLVVFMENQIDRKIVLAENLARERELEYSKANSSGARLSRVAGGLENKARVVAGSMLGVLSTVRIPRSMPIVSGQAFAAGLTAVILGASVTLAGSGVVARAGEMILGSAFQVRVIAIEYMSSSNSFALARTAKLSRIAEEETGKINTTVLSAVDTRVVMLPVIMRGVIDEAHEPIQISELAYERAEEIFETYPEPLASGDVVGAVVYSVNSPQELFVAMARETMLAYSLVGAYVLNDIETVLALHMQGVEVVSDGLLSTSAIVRDVSRHAPLAIGNAFVNASTATMSSYERALYAYVENIEVVPSVLVGTVHELGSSIGGFVALGVQSAPVVYNESVTTFANESASVGSMISEDSFAFGKESNKTVSGLLEAQDRAIAQSVEEARFAFTGFENVVANTALVIESTPSFATDAILGIAGSIAFRIEAVDTGVLSASPLASLDVERFIPDFLREVTSILARVAGSAFHGIFGPLAGFFGAGEEIGLVVIPELLNEEVASVGVMSSGETIVYEGPVTNIHNEYISVSNIGGVSQVYVDTQLESLRYSLVRSMENINRRSSTQTTTGISSIDDMTGSGLTLNSSTFNGGTIDGSVLDVATSTITGQLTVDGTAQASIVQATNYIAGPYILATSTTATSAFSGNIAVGRNTTLGTTASDYLIVNSTISSSLVPSVTNTYDIGSASKIWRRGYFDELVVNTFTIASSSVSGTVSDTFTVNSDNATNDLEDMSIIFDRGSASPNALLAWNSTSKRFEFNMPVFSANATFTNATTTSFETTNFTLNSSLFTSLLGTGLSNVGGALTLNATGDWTGTFDGIEGSAYLARANHTGTQLAATISDFAATARGLFSSTATGLTYTSGTGAFSLTSGYNIPLTASTTEWSTAYTSRLSSATYPLQFASNVLSLAFGTTTANTWSALQTFGNTVSTNATTTSFGINAETFMDLTGTGLQNTGGVLTLNATGDWTGTLDGQEGSYYLANSFATTSANFWETQQTARSADDLTNNSIEDLSDVAAMSEAFGNLLSWNGSTWTNVATSTLGIAISDTIGTLAQTRGGTGLTSYTSGDILYADNGGNLTALPKGSNGQVLKLTGGLPAWGTDIASGGGGGASAWATTTDNLAIYPADTSDVLIIGGSATSTSNSILEVFGTSYFSNTLGVATTAPSSLFKFAVGGNALFSGNVSLANLVATGTATTSNLTITSVASALLKTNSLGQIISAVAGTDYENPLTFGYPLVRTTNAISLAFGTTTANTWSALQTFGNTVSTNATTTSFGINAETFTDLTGTGLQNVGGLLTLNATGDWTGTFDGQEGSAYLARANHTGTQLAATISDFAATARGLFSSSATGLTYTSGTGAFSLTSGYSIPLTASTTEWSTAYTSRLSSATYPLQFASNVLSLAFGTTTANSWSATQTFSVAPILTGLSGLLQGNGSSAVTAITGTAGQFPYYNGTNTLAATSSIFLATSGNVGIGTTTPLAKLQVGAYYANNSSDSQILISRQVDDSVAGNGHAFSDSSNVNRSGTIGYNSYDARITYSGSNNYDHYAAFQAAPVYGSSGTMSDLYGVFDGPTANSGTITNRYGVYVSDVAGAGTITNNYGLYAASLTRGTNNFGVYTAGATKSYFGGNVGIGTTSPYAKLSVVGEVVAQNFTATSTTATSTISGNLVVGLGSGNKFLMGTTTQFSNPTADVAFQHDWTNGGTAWYFTNKSGTQTVTTADGQYSTFYVNNFSGNAGLFLQKAGGGSGDYLVAETAAGLPILSVKSAGNVGIGTTTPFSRLSVAGNAYIGGNLTATGTATIGTLTGLIKGTAGILSAAVAGTDYVAGVTGDWTGTFDGQEGSYYLARANHTGTQLASTISDFSATARGLFSSTATGLTYTSGTGVFSLTSGYEIPLTASTTNWNTFYGTPSARITAGNGLSWSSNTLNVSTSSLSSGFFLQGGNSFGATAVLGTNDSNALTFEVGGTEYMRIGTSGSVGIGTQTPGVSLLGSLLDVQGSQNSALRYYLRNTNAGSLAYSTLNFGNDSVTNVGGIYVNSSANATYGGASSVNLVNITNSPLSLATNDTVRLMITGAGNVGIGSTTPWGQLSASSTSAYPALAIEQKSTGPAAVFLGGNVGIGTSSPFTTLSVTGNSYLAGTLTTTGTATIGTLTGLIKGTSGVLSAATAGTDYENPLTFGYPLVRTTNAISLAFGTTTANSWSSTQTFSVAPILTGLSGLLQGNGSSAVTAITGTAGQFPYYNGTNTLAATSTIFLATSGNVGIGTTTPSAQFAMQGAATAGAVTSFAVYGNTPTASGAGGGILLNGGAANAGFGNGGAVAINGGAGNTSSTGGAVTLTGGAGWTGGAVAISGGAGNSIVGGALTLSGGNGPSGIAGATASFGGGSSSGAVALTLTGAPSNVAGGAVTLTGGLGAQGGGSLNLLAGNSSSGSFSSGTVYIAGGTGGTAQGNVVLAMNNAGTAIGNVSIASTTPYARLSVWGAGATSATRAFEAVNSASTTLMVIRNDGNVGIGTTTPGSLLSVAGAAYVSGFINTSGITGGYKQDGSTILMASSTNFSTLVGDEAGRLLGATGFRSTAVGYNALYTATSSDNNTAVGYYALRVTTSGESNTVVGAQSLQANTTGSFNVALGDEVLLANTTGSFNTAIGSNAMRNANTGSRNFGLGYAALSANTGNDNMGIGYLALSTNTSGTDNTGIGYNAFGQTTTGSYNIGMGYTVGLFNKTGTSNVAIGTAALYSNTSATSTVSIGYLAAYGSASYNSQGSVAIGYQAGRSFATGSDYNTLVGYKSGDGLTTGARNVLLGNSTIAASYNQVTTGSNNIAIGNDVAVPTATASNQLVIGNLIYGTGLSGTGATVSTGNIGIGTTSPSQALSVQGNGLFSGNLSSANLTATGTATIGSLTGLIKGTSGVLSAATAGTDYENPLTFGYPLVRTTNAISLAFGTTTSNTWAGTQTFTNAPVLTSLATPAGTFLAVNAAGTIIATTTPAGGGSGTVGTGTTGQFPYYAAGGTTLTATSSIFLAASGNVGVGSTTPNTKFVVQGSSIGNVQLGQFASNANYGAISLNGRGLADAGFNFASSNLDAALAINRPTGAVISFRENNGTSQMVIAAGGNVGIGTISPSSLLHLAGSAGASLNTILEPTGWSGLKHRFGVQYSGDTSVLSNNALLTSATAGTLDNTAQTGSALILGSSGILNYVQASAGSGSRTFTSRLYVDSAGSVGIGTTSPSSLLHLEASSPVLTLKSNISSGLTGINFQNNTSGGAGTLSFNHNTGEIKFGNTAGTGYFTTFYSGNGTEKMRIDTAGNVGIGTTSPMSLLSVSGLSTLAKFKSTTNVTNAFTVENSTGTNVFQVDTLNNSDSIFSVASSTGSTYFYVGASGNIGIGTTTPGAALDIYNGALCVDDATPTCQNAARTAGTIYAVSTSLTGIDLAERYPTKDPTLAKGEIVMLDPENPVFVSRASDGAAFLGVVSTKPGIELGGFNDVLYKGEKHVPLALAGRVPILVNMEGGPIKPGDAITISSVPGVGKKATDSVQTIGVALEPASQNGSVQVFIKPEYTFIPKSVALASATSTVNAVSASTLAVSDAATFTGTLRADVVRASSVIVPRVTTSYVFESTSYTPIIPDEALTASGVNLYTLSTYTLAKAQDMTAKLVALNLSLDTLEARIAALESTASSTPALNESGFLSMFESAFGSLGASVSDGVASFLKLKVGDLVIGKQADNRSAAGAGSILAGNTVVEVTNSKALPSSRIIITSTSAVSGSWYISTKAVGSFRITLTNAQENDFTFDYLIIQTEGDDETPQATQSQDVSPEPTVPVTVTAPNTSTSVTGDETSVPAPDPIIPDPLPTQPAPAPIVAPEPPPAPVVSPEPVPAPVPSETPSESSTPAP